MRTTPTRLLLLLLLAFPATRAYAQADEAYLEEDTEPEAPGGLQIITIPPGAEILVDGRPWPRRSPTVLEGLSAGEHQLTIIRDELLLQTTVVVLSGETKALDINLRAPAGAIKVISDPTGADVYLDGQLRGQAPLVLPVPFGVHQLRVARAGHRDYEVPLEISSLDQIRVAVHLERGMSSSGGGDGGRVVTAETEQPGTGEAKEDRDGANFNYWPWIAVGVGVALVGAGIGFEVHAADAAQVAEDERERYTVARRASIALKHYDNAEHNRQVAENNETVAWALMGSGAAVMVGGLIWYLLDPDDEPAAQVAVTPQADGASLWVGGQW